MICTRFYRIFDRLIFSMQYRRCYSVRAALNYIQVTSICWNNLYVEASKATGGSHSADCVEYDAVLGAKGENTEREPDAD